MSLNTFKCGDPYLRKSGTVKPQTEEPHAETG